MFGASEETFRMTGWEKMQNREEIDGTCVGLRALRKVMPRVKGTDSLALLVGWDRVLVEGMGLV
jgi:hypothetical protein